ncbi:hypothetical protein LWI29_024207 [Acer saccharum]|uniref:Josephin-like protein n=1 Tax=Acer saccharum TaxID=4024 RepID=A0AA39THE5_ACESA|nr:hypothetical protein LWI29_024207 [Acer saccharum]KAK1589601.1 hypothetical protein Q3G72_035636 [Acer saccharum]
MSTRGSNQVSSRAAIKKETPTQKPNSTTSKVVDNKSSNGICGLRGSNQVSCIPSINKETAVRKRNCLSRVAVNKRSTGTCGIRLPKKSEFSPVRILKHLRSKMAKGICSVSLRKRSSPTVSSSGRSKPSVIPVDSHRTEAIEDCIEFINSSSSLPRSNSVSASSC